MICNLNYFDYLCTRMDINKTIEMVKEMSIHKLAHLDFNSWLCELPEDDNRWFELIDIRKDLCPDFDGWLKTKGLERTPKNALEYLSERYDIIYGESDRLGAMEAHDRLDKTLETTGFRLLLQKRLAQYKNKPYQGELKIGHFVGIKNNPEDNPLDYKENHHIGLIWDYVKDKNGSVTSFILRKEDGGSLTVPVEYTYRIY